MLWKPKILFALSRKAFRPLFPLLSNGLSDVHNHGTANKQAHKRNDKVHAIAPAHDVDCEPCAIEK